ncbi:MAG: molybdopterin molybdenumtransferase MoeA [Deltaproteobacteria bacterium]|nr:MAG: molybdopterin molybdenumtransferase MoeA [Deltaproteobacteria bacterium]
MMPEFFKVVTPAQVFDTLLGFNRLGVETVPLDDALHRVCGDDIASPEDLPPLPRSTMDGYAVRAADTFGASDSIPTLLDVAGAIAMGQIPGIAVGPGQAAAIPTGGFLPQGADAVVMVEYTSPAGEGAIEISRPVTAGENVLGKAEDVARGDIVIPAGKRLLPQEIGLLAGLGITRVPVHRRPKAALISTGDEIVPVTDTPTPGKIRDINSHSIAALVRAAGGEVEIFAPIQDDPALLRDALDRALASADVVVLSGGSSVGERDHMLRVVSSLPGSVVHAHGIAISPGKPTLIAAVGGKPVFGLPGHPVSALVVAQIFLAPFLGYLQGQELKRTPAGMRVRAVLASSVHSAQGREEYVRVKLEERQGLPGARPVFGKSGMLSTLVKADGFVVLPIHAEGLPAGEMVEVFLF